jgi:hypothetical protein
MRKKSTFSLEVLAVFSLLKINKNPLNIFYDEICGVFLSTLYMYLSKIERNPVDD